MIYFHPIFTVVAIALWLYVLSSGLKRFQTVHFGRKALFPWKRHVAFGKWAMAGFFLAWISGEASTLLAATETEKADIHGLGGTVIVALALVGLFAGLKLDKNRGASDRLRLVHGLCNMLASVLVLGQIYTGLSLLP